MKKRTLLFRNLIFYRRVNLVVILGMVIAVTVIVGSLAVGDSVKNTLLDIVRLRLGKVNSALIAHENLFSASLSEKMNLLQDKKAPAIKTAPLLLLNGMATEPQGKYLINAVNVIGINHNFPEFSLGKASAGLPKKDQVIINKTTAQRLELKPGDELILRLAKPDLLPGDVPLVSANKNLLSLRLTVKAIADDNYPGNFSFRSTQQAPANIFISLDWLGRKTEKRNQANAIIARREDPAPLQKSLQQVWSLEDVGLTAKTVTGGTVNLTYDKIFIPESISSKALGIPGASGVLTYFVNSIDLQDKAGKTIRSTPYSFVAGLDTGLNLAVKDQKNEIAEDEIVINQWLAKDLKARIGDKIRLKYFLPGPMRSLVEKEYSFTVKAIIPMKELAADKSLMPDFPGLSDTEKCSDWDASIPIKMDLIRDKDEAYWKSYKGTPKAFISLKTAQDLWGNRFGDLTMIRFAPKKGVIPEESLRNALKPADFDLVFQSLRQEAVQAIGRGTGGNFSWLFMSLSFFLLFSAFMLTTLLFMLGVESRQNEFSTLGALGFSSCEIRSLFMKEGLILACIGSAIGAPLGLLFNKAILYFLGSVWQGAVGTATVSASVNPWTPYMGAVVGIIIAWITLRIALGKYTKNLNRVNEEKTIVMEIPQRIKIYLLISIVLCVIAIILIIIGLFSEHPGANPAIFFSCGGLLILSDWLCWRYCLEWIKKHNFLAESPTPFRLALKNTTFKPMRSMAAVILLSCGIFLTIAVAINKRTTPNPRDKSSGTGGYTFFIKTSMPVTHNLNSEQGQKSLGLDKELFKNVAFVNLSLSEGDNASCQNLSQVTRPGILGVNFADFADPERFTFVGTGSGISKPKVWEELNREPKTEDRRQINAVADMEVIMWSMGKMVGSKLEISDEAGKQCNLQLNGALAPSIFQGYVLIPKHDFHTLFPSIGGARILLVEVPEDKVDKVKEALATALMDYGAEITTCSSRLDEFYRVANTYLSIFLILGGLGVLIGTAGFGAIVLRNITERRFELAIMNATGYSKELIRKIVTQEHAILILAGGLSGGITAFVAVIPALFNSAATNPPYLLVISLFVLIMLCGIGSVYIAAWLATRGSTLAALRKE